MDELLDVLIKLITNDSRAEVIALHRQADDAIFTHLAFHLGLTSDARLSSLGRLVAERLIAVYAIPGDLTDYLAIRAFLARQTWQAFERILARPNATARPADHDVLLELSFQNLISIEYLDGPGLMLEQMLSMGVAARHWMKDHLFISLLSDGQFDEARLIDSRPLRIDSSDYGWLRYLARFGNSSIGQHVNRVNMLQAQGLIYRQAINDKVVLTEAGWALVYAILHNHDRIPSILGKAIP